MSAAPGTERIETARRPAPRAPRTWRLLLDPRPRTGAEHMARDWALVEAAHHRGAAFLRLYRWNPPCLSFGRNEPARARYDVDAIARLGLDVVRRPTGGRAVWHEQELTYAVAAPIMVFGSLRDAYLAIHRRLAAALARLGVAVTLAPGRRAAGSLPVAGACFATSVGGEVLADGRKVIGSAQVRYGSALLQHGSILLDGSQAMVHRVTREPEAGSGGTTVRAALGRAVPAPEVAEAIVAEWGDPCVPAADPIPSAAAVARFSAPDWIWRR